jgi:hypothetical protein
MKKIILILLLIISTQTFSQKTLHLYGGEDHINIWVV